MYQDQQHPVGAPPPQGYPPKEGYPPQGYCSDRVPKIDDDLRIDWSDCENVLDGLDDARKS
ncbi:LOW QUALITY PROTEIN: hypothetical protein YC2023_010283 [Brassica napus]